MQPTDHRGSSAMSEVRMAAQTPEERLAAAGLVLPPPLKTTNLFRPTARDGNLLYVAGHVAKDGESFVHLGRVGDDISLDQAKRVVEQVVLSCLSSIKNNIRELSRVRRILKMVGFFAAVDGFNQHSALLNIGSQVLITAFGEIGQHARSAVGVASLPHGASVEVEMVVSVND